MKNRQFLSTMVCIGAILAAGMPLVMGSCESDPEFGDRTISGSVSIPKAVLIGGTIEAHTVISGSSALSYEWLHSDAENGIFEVISDETGRTITLNEKAGVIETGRYIRVTVTQANRQGFLTSEPALIFDSDGVTVSAVSISIEDDITEVRPGQTYQLSAAVTHNLYDGFPQFFQEVIWEIAEKTTGAGSTTITTDGMLHVSSDIWIWTHELTITAKSVLDVDDEFPSNILKLDVTGFEVIPVPIDANNRGQTLAWGTSLFGTLASGITTAPDGEDAWYIEHAKVTGNRYEVRFWVLAADAVNFAAGGYTRIAVDIAADNMALLNDITGFSSRLRKEGIGDYIEWDRTDDLLSFKEKLSSDPQVFATMEWASTAGVSIENQGGTDAGNLTDVTNIFLRFRCGSDTDLPGKIYFRNLRLYKDN